MTRPLGLAIGAALLVALAIITDQAYVWFFLYLGAVTLLAAYVLARRGLSQLEAGSWLDRQHATVGDPLAVTYTLRNLGRLPKPWLEVHSPSTLPVAVPGRVVALGPRSVRSWVAKVPLGERGQFRVDPMVVRTGDPFGLFESVATVGPGTSLLVYPRVAPLPAFRLPPAGLEGDARRQQHGHYHAPLVSSVRPYTPGDAFNRIHWRSSARHQELQVKEFDIEQTADVMLYLDLERSAHAGSGQDGTIETLVEAAASIAGHALADGRGVGLEAVGLRRAVMAPDRGARQRQKLLALLAVAQPEGDEAFAGLLLDSAARPRRGTVAIAITPSLDPTWVTPLAALRRAGATPLAVVVDPLSHADASMARSGRAQMSPTEREPMERELRSLTHTLGEHDVDVHVLHAGVPLAEQIVSTGATARTGAAA